MGEEIILKFHPTRLRYIKLYFFGLLLILFGLFGYFGVVELGIPNTYFLLGLFPGIILIFVTEVSRLSSTYTITNQRIIERYGILSKHVDSVSWDMISTLSSKQSPLERLVNVGDIELWSVGGAEEPEITLIDVPNMKKVSGVIASLIKKKISPIEKAEEKEVLPEKVVSMKIKPKLKAEKVESIASKYLRRERILTTSIIFSRFLSETGVWQLLLYTNKGYYAVEVSDDGKVVGLMKLTDEEARNLKQKYLEEKF